MIANDSGHRKSYPVEKLGRLSVCDKEEHDGESVHMVSPRHCHKNSYDKVEDRELAGAVAA